MEGNIIKTAKRRIPEAVQGTHPDHWCVVPAIEYKRDECNQGEPKTYTGRIRLYVTPKNRTRAKHDEVYDTGWVEHYGSNKDISQTARAMVRTESFLEDILSAACDKDKHQRFNHFQRYQG